MPISVQLTTDELLTTTRAVRRRLDFTRPVPRSLVEECLECAIQAPTSANGQYWDFVVVEDAAKKAAIGGYYRRAWDVYLGQPEPVEGLPVEGSERAAQQARVMASAQYLVDHFHQVPIFMIPCVHPRADEAADSEAQCSLYGGVMPAAWSFQLAARARGLASCWTTLHPIFEREIAELLGIDYTQTQQVAGICLARSKGTAFKPAPREPLASKLHWDTW
jgi:nitroreductase